MNRLKIFERFMYPILIVLLGYLVFVSRTDLSYFNETYLREGGPNQWLIFGTLMFGAFMSWYRAYILKPFRGSLFAFCLVVFGFLFFAYAMEEISWGQSIFNFPSPDFFRLYNKTGQTNLRNLVVWGIEVNQIVFTLGVKIFATLYFFILPFAYKKYPDIKYWVNRYAIPLPRYTQFIAYLVLFFITQAMPSEKNYEVFEFGFYWILVLMVYNPLNYEVFSRTQLNR